MAVELGPTVSTARRRSPASGVSVGADGRRPRGQTSLLGAGRENTSVCEECPPPTAHRAPGAGDRDPTGLQPDRRHRGVEPSATRARPFLPVSTVPLERGRPSLLAGRDRPRDPYDPVRGRPPLASNGASSAGSVTGGAHAFPKQTSARASLASPCPSISPGRENGGGGSPRNTHTSGCHVPRAARRRVSA